MEDFHIQWHITDRCNLRCVHCYSDSFKGDNELDLNGLYSIADNLIDFVKKQKKLLTLSLTGGEPLLKEELFLLLDYLSKSSYIKELSIITNGTLIDRYITFIKDIPKIKNIYVSLDGLESNSNDLIRGKGVFRKVLSNIKKAKQAGLKITLMYTLFKENLADIDKAVNFIKENNIDNIIIERFIPLGQSKERGKVRLVNKEELKQVYQQIFYQSNSEFFSESVKYHALKVSLERGEPDLLGAECIVAKAGCAVLPGGDVLPCRRFASIIGNLLKESLEDIWFDSPLLKELRDRNNLKGKCKGCIIEECWGCRALANAVTKDYLEEDPLCWLDKNT